MKKKEQISIIAGSILLIAFILVGVPKISDALVPVIGRDIRMVFYIAILLIMYLMGRKQSGKFKKVDKELNDLTRELLNNHRIDYYIMQNKRLYKEVDNKRYRAVFLMNIATAYHYDGQYKKSNDVIAKIDLDCISEGQEAALFNQQFLNYVNQGKLEKAGAVYKKHEELLRKFEQDKQLRNHYVVSRLSYNLACAGQNEEAIAKVREEFDTVSVPKKTYDKAYAYRFLEGRLLIAEGKRQEGREILKALKDDNIMPGMKRDVEKELKY